MAFRPRVFLRLAQVHFDPLAVLLVDQNFTLHVELLDLRERDAHRLLDRVDHQLFEVEHLAAQ
ncbi:hypothetical protein D3C83_288120 [compost metagenome]